MSQLEQVQEGRNVHCKADYWSIIRMMTLLMHTNITTTFLTMWKHLMTKERPGTPIRLRSAADVQQEISDSIPEPRNLHDG